MRCIQKVRDSDKMNFLIRSECHDDRSLIWDLNQAAFGGDAEASLVDSLRVGGLVEVSLVTVIDEQIVGHILVLEFAFWKHH